MPERVCRRTSAISCHTPNCSSPLFPPAARRSFRFDTASSELSLGRPFRSTFGPTRTFASCGLLLTSWIHCCQLGHGAKASSRQRRSPRPPWARTRRYRHLGAFQRPARQTSWSRTWCLCPARGNVSVMMKQVAGSTSRLMVRRACLVKIECFGSAVSGETS